MSYTCDECGGSGRVQRDGGPDGGDNRFYYETCPTCDGAGKTSQKIDRRENCPNCQGVGKKWIGSTQDGQDSYSHSYADEPCPYCGGSGKYKGKGFCFISTLVCMRVGKDDNCEELVTLRKFRDEYLLTFKDGVDIVNEYYALAPDLVKRMEHHDTDVFIILYNEYLLNVLKCIDVSDNDGAISRYKEMVNLVKSL